MEGRKEKRGWRFFLHLLLQVRSGVGVVITPKEWLLPTGFILRHCLLCAIELAMGFFLENLLAKKLDDKAFCRGNVHIYTEI